MCKFNIEVGGFWFSQTREFLNECKEKGLIINWIEGPGFFSKTFIIYSDNVTHLETVRDLLPVSD